MSSGSRSTTSTPSPPPRDGLDLLTLVIAAAASAVAAIVVSRVWRPGTIMAAAMTPVIVALVREGLDRPARRVSAIASRSAPEPVARVARVVAPPPPEADAPPPPVGPSPELTARRVYGRKTSTRRRWRLAVVTGLLAFVVAACVLTVPELLAGRSVVSSGKDTTVFGGSRRTSHTPATEKKQTTTDQQTTSTPTDTQSQQTTSTPTDTQPQQTTTTQTAPGQTPTTQQTPAPGQTAPPAGSATTMPAP